LLSPELFSLFLTAVLSVTDSPSGALVGEVMIDKLTDADNKIQISESLLDFQSQTDIVHITTNLFEMNVNTLKVIAMHCSRQLVSQVNSKLYFEGHNIECVGEFTFLGSILTSDNDHSKDIKG
jgi:hypothetical protein